jgi:hypothetical protein
MLHYKLETIKNRRDTLQVRISFRVTTPIDMLFLMEQLNTEQETSGKYDVLHMEIRDYLNSIGYMHTDAWDFFKGMSDVIVEMTLTLMPIKGEEIVHKATSDKVFGEVFLALIKHFNLPNNKFMWNLQSGDCYDEWINDLTCLR